MEIEILRCAPFLRQGRQDDRLLRQYLGCAPFVHRFIASFVSPSASQGKQDDSLAPTWGADQIRREQTLGRKFRFRKRAS